MMATKPAPVTSEDPIVRAAVESAVAEMLASKSGDDEAGEHWINPLNPIAPKSFNDERLFS